MGIWEWWRCPMGVSQDEYEAANYAQRTGDVEPIKQVYDLEKCKACVLFTERLPEYTKDGKKLINGDYKIVSIKTYLTPTQNGRISGIAQFSITRPEPTVLDKNGSFLYKYGAIPETGYFYELEFSSHWIVINSRFGNKP